MQFVGIDPGRIGAIAWMDGEKRRIGVHDCPLLASGGFDYELMAQLISQARADGGAIYTMEAVHAMPSDGKCSAFSFGRAYEAWIAVMGVFGETPNLVSPRTWKRTMLAGIANDKEAEALALERRFQGHKLDLRGPRGGLRDGRVDAIFLAEYGRMTWKTAGVACRSGR